MKKTLNYLLMSLVAVALSMGLVACSGDDAGDVEGGGAQLETPTFETDAAKYEIQDASSAYASIELTASGNYIIQKNGVDYAAPAKMLSEKFAPKPMTMFANQRTKSRASEYANVLYGKYTKLADGKYALEGFGVIEINYDAEDNAYSLEVTPDGGATETLTASKTHVIADGSLTNNLCRTWNIAKFRTIVKVNGRTYFDTTFKTMEEFYRKAYEATGDGSFLEELEYMEQNPEEYLNPEQVVFTKSGTYMVWYSNGTLAVSFWRWYNENNGVLQYSWADVFEEDETGYCDIAFKSNQCVVTETHTETEDGFKMETISTTYLEEAK